MSLDKNLTQKIPGDPIKSSDWNALAAETVRLDAATKLNSQSIGFQMLQGNSWDNWTAPGDWMPVINKTLDFDTPTSLLLIGQGHGHSDSRELSLRVAIRVNDTLLGLDKESRIWGGGFLSPFTDTQDVWFPITAIAGCPVPKGKSKVELVIRCEGQDNGSVALNAPTLWLIQLGAS
ncbi:hypothetical protein [Streptomyces sp. 3214.6]|uniref:hypothetical protein n=1 Tax=Streptomyces sp. 3214.6 TaxID=1882757 RepID=UPI00090A5F73|nr:hypothetical protein [Streptomyces sp. 3214.6]SHH84862.1 hypothetical protein SAMN05444521_2214 [Streptomyces sp. 3214.6]